MYLSSWLLSSNSIRHIYRIFRLVEYCYIKCIWGDETAKRQAANLETKLTLGATME